MKKIIAVITALFSTVTYAQDYARVISTQPRFENIAQHRCRQVPVERIAMPNPAGGVLGTIAGAAIGSQIGNGSGRDVSTVVGAVLGNQFGQGVPRTVIEYHQVCDLAPIIVQRGKIVVFEFEGKRFAVEFN